MTIHAPLPFNDSIRPGRGLPEGFHLVLAKPAPLAGCALPRRRIAWDHLYRAGFRHVVCLCSYRPQYDPAPLEFLSKLEIDDLAETPIPQNPEAEARRILGIANLIVKKLEAGEGVLVHCAGGRGRTGTVIGRVLRSFGNPGREVTSHLNDLHLRMSGRGWPESDWQSCLVSKD